MGVESYQQDFTQVRELPQRLSQPLKVKQPAVWFVNSMSDLYQEGVSDDFIEQVFATMAKAPWHQFQVLTKRADRLKAFHANRAALQNVWLGVSVENKKQGVPRIDALRSVPAAVRFLSVEPLLEDLGTLDLSGIHWVIVGGESGSKARPMKLAWVTSIKAQCEAAGVPFFFKQWGAYGVDGLKRSKHSNGRQLGGNVYDGMPQSVAA